MEDKIRIVKTDLVKGVYVQHNYNYRDRLFYLMSIEEFNENNCRVPEFDIRALKHITDEEEIYVQHCELKEKGSFIGEVLTPSQLKQISDYIWRTVPIG